MIFYKLKRKIYKLLHPAIGEVLMLHRVVTDRSVLEDNRLMEITPEYLEKTIQDYQKRNYQFISLDQLYERISTKKRFERKFVCFTLDDGYIDNYTTAYSIFKKYNCPFAIYLTTDFPDGKALLWWYVLEDILLKNDKIRLGDGSEYFCDTMELKNQTFRLIREKIFLIQQENLKGALADLFSPFQYSFTDILKDKSMSWKQIKELSEDPLCTIGSHSVSHAALDRLSVTLLQNELVLSRQIIEGKINKPVLHFAYPYGRVSADSSHEVESAGYLTAVLANGGVERIDISQFKIRRKALIEL